MYTRGSNASRSLVPFWREQLEDALDNNKYGGDDSLAAHICQALIALRDRPRRDLALATARGVQRQRGPFGAVGESVCKVVFDRIWLDISCDYIPTSCDRTLRCTWRPEYDSVMRARYNLRYAQPAATFVMLHLLRRLKVGRSVTIADAAQIAGKFLGRNALENLWLVCCDIIDNIDMLAMHYLGTEETAA